MTELHPSPETLARYVRGELDRAAARDLELHLAGCVACQARVDSLPAAAGSVVRWQGHRFARRPAFERSPADEQRRGELRAVGGALGGILGSIAQGFLNRLLAASEIERRKMLREEESNHSLAVCELLLSRCREAWFDDPPRAVELGRLAVALAGYLDPFTQGSRVEHLRALAWMHLGNAYRIAAHYDPSIQSNVADPEAGRWPADSLITDAPDPSEEAEAALREIRDAFLDRGMDLDAALVTLDLATVYVKQSRLDEVTRIAVEASTLFADRSATAKSALAMLDRFAGRGEVTLDLLDRIAKRLASARDVPMGE